MAGVLDGLFDETKKNGRGALVLTAHMGNPELIRAVATMSQRFGVTVLVHTAHAEAFNSVINQFSAQSTIWLVQVSEITVATAMRLSEDIERGDWVMMTADHNPVDQKQADANVPVTFLGDTAQFPVGAYILAGALKCPTYFLACARLPLQCNFQAVCRPVILPRKDRQSALTAYAQSYDRHLVGALIEAPLQWFNFFDFWADDAKPAPSSATSSETFS